VLRLVFLTSGHVGVEPLSAASPTTSGLQLADPTFNPHTDATSQHRTCPSQIRA
jgi:hypothetical protein